MPIFDLNPSLPPSRPVRPVPSRSPIPPEPVAEEPPALVPALHRPTAERKPTDATATAPADLARSPAVWERIAWYAGTVIVTALLLAAGLRLDQIDLHAPIAYDVDALLIMPMVKGTLERGFGGHWRNERLGSPGIQELHDFPVIDHLHFAVIWLIGQFVSDWILVYNLYFLLTWPLAALTALFALRHLRLSLPFAAAGAILYAFQPYHYLRGETHYFLAAYWVVPLSLLPALAILKGEPPFVRRDPDGRYRLSLFRRESLWQVLLAAATASAGAYYAFFACAIYAFAGVYGWVAQRTWKAAASAGVLVVLVGGFGVVNHLPTFAYVAHNARNSLAERFPEEAEIYSLKLTHLILPVDGHNLIALCRLKNDYNSPIRPLNNENACATLGAVGAVGLLGLLVSLVLPVRRSWPYAPLAALVVFSLLLAMMGGFGSVFNLLVFDQVRCYNRISIYLAFVCLFAVLWPLDRFFTSRTGRARWLRIPAAVALVVLGIADQTPAVWFSPHVVAETEREAERFRADRRFFAQVEELMPPGAKVFSSPFIEFPEVLPLHAMGNYEPARGYLHTRTLVWSYGAIKNREVSRWQEEVCACPPAEFLHRIVVRGFEGLFVDKRGFIVTDRNQGDVFVEAIRREAEKNGQVKLPLLTHEDGRQVFLDLRPYRDWLIRQDPVYFEAEAQREQEWATITWLRGFHCPEPVGYRDRMRWGYASGTAVIVNPSDRTRTFELSAVFGTDRRGVFRIGIDGGDLVRLESDGTRSRWADEFTIEKKAGSWVPGLQDYGPRRVYRVEVPPGRHVVKFRCQVPPVYTGGNSPPYRYFLKDIKFTEVKGELRP